MSARLATPSRYNGAPTQDYPIIIVDELAQGSSMFVSGRWGFVTKTGGLVINARSETVATNGLFKWSYQPRRALMPIDGFFEWKDIYSTGTDKQPYAIAMRSHSFANVLFDFPGVSAAACAPVARPMRSLPATTRLSSGRRDARPRDASPAAARWRGA
jgi:hypothetical protein